MCSLYHLGNSYVEFICAQIWMNARQRDLHLTIYTTTTTAMLILTVPTPRDRSTVPVIRDTLEMESRVLVRIVYEQPSQTPFGVSYEPLEVFSTRKLIKALNNIHCLLIQVHLVYFF